MCFFQKSKVSCEKNGSITNKVGLSSEKLVTTDNDGFLRKKRVFLENVRPKSVLFVARLRL